MLLNTVARLPSVVVGAEAARDFCNALFTGLEDTCAAASDAYATGNRKKLPVCFVLASVCWLAKNREDASKQQESRLVQAPTPSSGFTDKLIESTIASQA